jgi:hypothetical protein
MLQSIGPSEKWVSVPSVSWNVCFLLNWSCSIRVWVKDMVVNATLYNISAISWRSVLLVRKPKYREKTALGPMDCNIRGTNILLRQCYIFFYFYFIAWTYNIAMCVLDYDPCNPNPCTHGTCTTSSGSVQCSCHSGYSGATCGKHCWFDPHLYHRWQLRNTYKRAHIYTHSPNVLHIFWTCPAIFIMSVMACVRKRLNFPLNTVYVQLAPA